MSDVLDFNVNDIVEQYNKNSGRGINKYLVTKKTFTKHRGIFYDLLFLEQDQDEKPNLIFGFRLVNLKDSNLHFRKYFDAQKQI